MRKEAVQWKPLHGFECCYEVSSDGQFKRTASANGTHAGRLLQPCPSNRGYLVVTLHKNQRQYTSLAATLIARTFIGPRPPKYTINHKNGIKTDNNVSNLEYVTHAENVQHAHSTGLTHPLRGEKTYNAKLKDADVVAIMALRGKHLQRVVGAMFGTSNKTISRLWRGDIWKHITRDGSERPAADILRRAATK